MVNKPSLAQIILQGDHPLRPVASKHYFGFIDTVHSMITDRTLVEFSWKLNDGKTYTTSSLPFGKIHVSFDEQQTVPLIRYQWEKYTGSSHNPDVDVLMQSYVNYAVITLRRKDWPVYQVSTVAVVR